MHPTHPSSRLLSIAPRVVALTTWAALLGLLLSACADEPPLPPYRGEGVCYPVAMASDATGRWLYVAGANFDRTYRSGLLRVLDLEEGAFVGGARVGLPNYAGGLTVQLRPPAAEGGTRTRLFVPARDDDSITAIDALQQGQGPPVLTCGADTTGPDCPLDCGDNWRFGGDKASDIDVGDDPIGVELVPAPGGKGTLAHVVSTTGGQVSIIEVADIDKGGLTAKIHDTINLGAGLSATATSPLTGRTYVSDSRAARLYSYSVAAGTDEATGKAKGYVIQPKAPITLPVGGGREYGRGLALSSDGARLYVAYRSPNALLVVDIAPTASGDPRDELIETITLGGKPARIAVAPTGADGRDLVYVSCFGSDDVWIVDPLLSSVLGVVRLPHSPYAIATTRTAAGGWRLVTALFNIHTIVDVPLVAGLPPADIDWDASPPAWKGPSKGAPAPRLFRTGDCAPTGDPEEARKCL